jgi:hypothetical protein
MIFFPDENDVIVRTLMWWSTHREVDAMLIFAHRVFVY